MMPWKEKILVSKTTPTFSARVIGYTETFTPNNAENIGKLLQKMWDNAPREKRLPKATLTIGNSGVRLTYSDSSEPVVEHHTKDIPYCCVNLSVHDRIFAWVNRNTLKKQFMCHAVILQEPEYAAAATDRLTEAFQNAFKVWKKDVDREKNVSLMRSMSDDDVPEESVCTKSSSSFMSTSSH